MDKGKKIMFIILISLLVIIIVLAIILSNKEDNDIDKDNNIDSDTLVKDNISLTRVDDADTFFSIQNSLNTALDDSGTYTLTKIMYTKNSSNTYYYMTGYYYYLPINEDEEVSYDNLVNYLLILDNNTNKYIIEELSDDYDIENNDITLDTKSITSGNDYVKENISYYNVLTSYISSFKNLFGIDNKRAYDMLYDNALTKYPGFTYFEEHLEEVYNLFSSRITAYNVEKQDNAKVYDAKDYKDNTIKIIEYHINDFKIDF